MLVLVLVLMHCVGWQRPERMLAATPRTCLLLLLLLLMVVPVVLLVVGQLQQQRLLLAAEARILRRLWMRASTGVVVWQGG